MARKKQTFKEPYASTTCGINDNYGRLYDSMLSSAEYKKLSLSAKYIYAVCRVQAARKEAKACLFVHGEKSDREYNENRHFVFTDKHMQHFNLDRRNVRKYINELVEHGFIDIVEHNKKQKLPNVYAFSNRWQQNK